MNKRQQMLQRMLRALLPVGILSRIIIGSLGISRAQIKAGTDHNFAKARVTAILSDYSDNTPFNGPQQVRAVLISGTWKGQEVELTKKEFDLLHHLLENKGRVLTREALLDSVWGFDFVGETNSVDVYIRFLRSKIDEAFGIKLIHTVRGVGYVIRED